MIINNTTKILTETILFLFESINDQPTYNSHKSISAKHAHSPFCTQMSGNALANTYYNSRSS